MKETSPESSLQELSSKIDNLTLGLKWLSAVAILFLSIPNFFVALAIARFAQLYHDAMPGKPLPYLTLFVIDDSSLLLILTFLWPLISILALTFSKKPWIWVGVSLILGVICFQILATGLGLYMPMISSTTGMSDVTTH